MKPIKLNWAYTPQLNNEMICGNTLVSIESYIDKTLFELVKPDWSGYIQKNNKKTALYELNVIDTLFKKGHDIVLDGVEIKNSDRNNFKLLMDCLIHNSTNSQTDAVSFLANAAMQQKKWNAQTHEVINKLNDMFSPSVRAVSGVVFGINEENMNFNHINFKYNYPTFNFSIDSSLGIRKAVVYDEISYEHFMPANEYRLLKPEHTVKELQETMSLAQEFPKFPASDIKQTWVEGYDEKTFEPKKNDMRWLHMKYK